MKKKIVTLILLPLLLLTETAQASGMGRRLKQKVAVTCLALISATTASAVVITKVTNMNHTPGWATRSRYYRDKHALAIFLGKGLGRKFADDEVESGGEVEVAIIEGYDSQENLDYYRVLFSGFDERMLLKSLYLSQENEAGEKSGYIVLPGITAHFELLAPRENGDREFVVRAMVSNQEITRGVLRYVSASEAR
jgi:hypothetical protein